MRDLTIRNLDESILVELQRRAWRQGLPLEVSLRRLLIASIEDEGEPGGDGFFLAQGAGRLGTAPSDWLYS
jgi:plasmid stability protein